jgi:GAF domain-containing protein
MKAQLPFNRTIQFGLVAVVVSLLIVAVAADRSVVVWSESAAWVPHTGAVLQHLTFLRYDMKNTESAYPDYALTDDNASEQSVLRALTADNPTDQRRLALERSASEVRAHRQSKISLVLGSVRALLMAAIFGRIVLRDRAARRLAENELQRINRLYAMVSGINALGIRVRDRDDLYTNACRIAVERGEFVMAWIGVVDRSELNMVPMTWAGMDQQAMDAIKAHFASSANTLHGSTLAARAIREKAPVISNDVQNDTTLILHRMHAHAGIRSIAVLPLIVSDNAIGVFVLYTSKPEFFDGAGMRLLTELAGNVAFAVDHIEKQERLDHFAYYDALTGLRTAVYFWTGSRSICAALPMAVTSWPCS